MMETSPTRWPAMPVWLAAPAGPRLQPEPDPGPPAPRRAPDPGTARLEQLIGAAVTGDRRAREALLAEVHPLVLRYCRARLGRQESVTASADDVAQEICLGVVHALPSYTLKGLSFRAFVYGIAAHKVTDAYRAIGRNRTEPVAEVPDVVAHGEGPEQRLLAGELSGQVRRLLDMLTSRQREVLVLRVAVGLSADETAVTLGSTPGAVRVTQHRALARLRSALAGSDTVLVEPVQEWEAGTGS